MYETYFGLRQRPFATAPDSQCCAALPTIRTAFESLFRHLSGSQGISILSAPAGLGKTLLCRKLAELLQNTSDVAFLPNALFSTRRSLLQAILYELDEPYSRMGEQELRLSLHSSIKAGYDRDRGFVLIVDEAHLLNERILEEIRSLTNFGGNGARGVGVLLSGQLALEEKLAAPGLEAINQRIVCHATLEQLSQSESVDYVEYRLKQAGGNVADILTPDAFRTICRVSDGVPRCLNQLCDHSLMLAMSAGETPVSDATVRAALDELKQLPLHWNEPPRERSAVETEASPRSETIREEVSTAAGQDEATGYASYEVGEACEPEDEPTYSLVEHPEIEHHESNDGVSTEVLEFGFDEDDSQSPSAAEPVECDVAIDVAGDFTEPEPPPEIVVAETATPEHVVTLETEPATDTRLSDAEWEWEDVDLIVASETHTTRSTPELAVGTFAPMPTINGSLQASGIETTATWAAGLPAEEMVADHYAALEIQMESRGRPADQAHLEPSLESQFAFVGVETPQAETPSEAEQLLRNLLVDSADNALRPVSIVDRVALLMQDLTGLGVDERAESPTTLTSSFDTTNCPTTAATDTLRGETQGVQTSAASNDGDRSTIAFQVAPRAGRTTDFDMPSQIVIEPGLGEPAAGEKFDDINATLADTLQETRQLIEIVNAALNTRLGLGESRSDTETSRFDAVLRSPYWTHLDAGIDSEIETYDVVQPEGDAAGDPTPGPERTDRFSTLFSDLSQNSDDQ